MSDSIKLRKPEEMILTQDDLNLCLGSKELLPCPFCGSKSIISHGATTPNGKAVRWEIACIRMEGLRPVCAASVWGTDPDQATARATAVAKWNRREPSGETKRLREALEASEKEVAKWKKNIIPFLGVHAGKYGQEYYGEGGMHYTHYDMLKEAGARMDDFRRCGDPPAGAEQQNTKPTGEENE